MNQKFQAMVILSVVFGLFKCGLANEPTIAANQTASVKIGVVAYSPATVTVFRDLTRYLTKNGLPADFVLYSGMTPSLKRWPVATSTLPGTRRWPTDSITSRTHVRAEHW